MQLTPRLRIAGALAGLAAFAPTASAAEIEEQEAGLRFEMFTDSDDVHVFTTATDYDLDLANGAHLLVGLSRQVVVVPAITAPAGTPEAVDAVSGASRPISSSQDPFSEFRKQRNQLDSSMRWRNVTAGYYLSDESDYFAQQVRGGYELLLFGENVELSLAASYGWDDIEPAADDDTATPGDHRSTLYWSAVATRVLTPTTMLQGGIENSQVDGLQHNPYRTVWVAGAYAAERHPDDRSRWDAFVKVNQYLPNRSSVNATYKHYFDDWGIESHTLGTMLHQYVNESVVVRYRYRFYRQSAADFWRDDYTEAGGVDGFQTADYRVGEFDAHLFGTKLTWDVGRGPLAVPALNGIRVHLKYERYFNSNNFSANIFESGLTLSF
ncbi:MAG: DUF3570 domain-containing protein [Candidatus Eiseniibacteriota bacterium]